MKAQAASKAQKRKAASQGKELPAKVQRSADGGKDVPRGFGRGLAADRIIGLRREAAGGVQFLVRWRGGSLPWPPVPPTGTEEADFVTAREAKAKIPQVAIRCDGSGVYFLQVVIEYYEEKLAWVAGENLDEDW